MKKQPERSAAQATFSIVRPHLGKHRMLMLGGVLALLADVALRVFEPWPMKIVVDALSRSLGAETGGGPEASVTLLILAGIATVVLVGLRAFANYLATVAFSLVGSRVATEIRGRVFEHVARLSKRYYSKNRSGDLVQRLISDVGRLQEVAVTAGLPMIANLITLVAMTIVMLVLDPVLAAVVVTTVALFWLSSRTSTKKITSASRKTRKAEGDLANIAQETLGAIQVVQAYSLEEHLSDRFSGSNTRSLRDGVKSRRLAAGLERRTDLLVGIASAVVLLFGGWRVLSQAMSLGDLIVFTTYLKTAMKPLRDMAKYTGRIARATASGERVADVLNIRPEVRTVSNPREVSKLEGGLRFSKVSVEFDGKHPVVHDIDFEIVPGERVAFVGHSGSGKSTLASLIPRLIDPSTGTIMVDGMNIRSLEVEFLRSQVALVQQEAVLFTGSVMDNIRLGRLEATDEEVVEAAKLARAHDFIERMPQGYETVIGERGSTLSGGQRQRLSIARAFLRSAPIVVLDEVTTGLDGENAEAVMSAIAQLTEGKTTIVVTHDDEVAAECDWVLKLEAGRLIWQGPGELYMSDGKEAGGD
ncbi:ABC transporter ATP-binding protein [Tessaracoccus sp. OH4464_COT-324]|uniref:ABC transporter ATP-binding protein n=1 Tax=Tessaracoccus sp. OH4464_COT-324 TaxID=2491059 RepID=UPI000F63940A|nr:ABC transporter ATP-binding protein [Tessaracoccus sp. OH4464_COT-324]RRD46887.1 ABC transporter ATP-binding protein [Tessaracoccus sp. OH4464_COT-324]